MQTDSELKIVKREYFYSDSVGWYMMMQLNWNGSNMFLCQQLPKEVTVSWEGALSNAKAIKFVAKE